MNEGGSKIGTGTWMVLIGIAIFFDVVEALISLIPIAGEIIAMFVDLIAFATFWLIFMMNGEKYSKKTVLAGFIIGFIPIVNMLPECTLAIVKLYFDAKAKNLLAAVPGGQQVAQKVVNRPGTPPVNKPNPETAPERQNNVTPINSNRNFSPTNSGIANNKPRESTSSTPVAKKAA